VREWSFPTSLFLILRSNRRRLVIKKVSNFLKLSWRIVKTKLLERKIQQ